MKLFTQTLIGLTISSALVVSANAAMSYGTNETGQFYVGAKVGQLDVDKPKDTTAYGVYAGYNFDRNFGTQVEYVGSDKADYSDNGLQHSHEAKSYGIYGTYRHPINSTPFYVNGRLGVAKTEVEGTMGKYSNNNVFLENSVRITETFSKDKTSIAGGVGVGFQATPNFGIEANYNYLNADAKMWGVSAHLSF